MDALSQGEKLYRKMVDAWLEAALVSFTIDGDREARNEFRAAFGRNPKHIVRAVTLFPETFNADNTPDLFDILAAIHLASKIKDDEHAKQLYAQYAKVKDYDALREIVKEETARGERKKKMLDVSVMCPNCRADVKTVVCV